MGNCYWKSPIGLGIECADVRYPSLRIKFSELGKSYYLLVLATSGFHSMLYFSRFPTFPSINLISLCKNKSNHMDDEAMPWRLWSTKPFFLSASRATGIRFHHVVATCSAPSMGASSIVCGKSPSHIHGCCSTRARRSPSLLLLHNLSPKRCLLCIS
jgi:hypothetical protein